MGVKNWVTRRSILLATALAVSSAADLPFALAQTSPTIEYGEVHEDNLRIRRGSNAPAQTEEAAPAKSSGGASAPSTVPGSPVESNLFASPPRNGSGTTPPASPSATQSAGVGATVTTPSKIDDANIWRPGKILTGGAEKTELDPTCIFTEAAKQAQAFPTSPEAAFIYSVALTRTSQVETAIAEVKHARRLAADTGDPNYFSSAVSQYEHILQQNPEDDCVRYGLAWAYYMQAYLYAEGARRTARTQAAMTGQAPPHRSKFTNDLFKGAELLASAVTGSAPAPSAVPHIPSPFENAPSWAVPQIRAYYEKCLAMIDEVVKRNPTEPWASVYKVHLHEEYSGNQQVAMQEYQQLQKKFPSNPAVSLFMADLNARQGHYAAGVGDFSRALQQRMQGK